MIELGVLSGAAAGRRLRLSGAAITLGRHPHCDLRFDPRADLDVSLRHARIRVEQHVALLEDCGSTNGTFLNDVRIERPTPLRENDVISLGARGPRISVRFVAPDERAAPPPAAAGHDHPTPAASAAAGSPPRRGAPRLTAAAGLLAIALTATLAYLLGRADAAGHEAELLALTRRTDSLVDRYGEHLSTMAGQVQGLDSALHAAREESRTLHLELERIRASRTMSGVDALSGRLDRAESRQQSLATLSRLDYSAIAEQSGRAVVLIAVEDANGRTMTGSGFSLTRGGLVITNRHLVQTETSRRPHRVAVIFSGTHDWLPARLVRVSDQHDLALLQVETPGPFPVVAGVSRSGSATRVGAPVAIIGYPLGTDTPMETAGGSRFTARYTLGAGTLSKALSTVLQIDAFAGEGSSGSPVFNAEGLVIGVIYGGARESAGRIVYAVPSEGVLELVPGR